jgi:DNA-directed RNA polymerase subunit RPC12/RpoP
MHPTIRTYVLADLKCYMCGATAGSIERERDAKQATISIQRGGVVGLIRAWEASRVRCPRCGGSVYVDQVEIVDRRIEPLEWEDDGPRRGRPPKWLVEQRRRKRERELSDQAARNPSDSAAPIAGLP